MKANPLHCLVALALASQALAPWAHAQNPPPIAGPGRFVPRVVADSHDPYVEAMARQRAEQDKRVRDMNFASSQQGIEQIQAALLKFPLTRNGYPIPGTEVRNSRLFPDLYSAACWSFAISGKYTHAADPLGAPEFYRNLVVLDYDTLRPSNLNEDFLATVQTMFPATRGYIEALRSAFPLALHGNKRAAAAFAENAMKVILTAHGFQIDDNPHPPYMVLMRHAQGVWWGWDHWALAFDEPIQSGAGAKYSLDVIQTVPDRPIYHGCKAVWDEHMPLVEVGVKKLLPQQYLILYQLVRRTD